MNDGLTVVTVGAFIYGALYVAGVFIAGLVWGNAAAVLLSIASAGVVYLAQLTFAFVPKASGLAWAAAITINVAAGASLLIGG